MLPPKQVPLYVLESIILSLHYLINRMQDLALATAGRVGANYVLAQDPDSDRFSAAERG